MPTLDAAPGSCSWCPRLGCPGHSRPAVQSRGRLSRGLSHGSDSNTLPLPNGSLGKCIKYQLRLNATTSSAQPPSFTQRNATGAGERGNAAGGAPPRSHSRRAGGVSPTRPGSPGFAGRQFHPEPRGGQPRAPAEAMRGAAPRSLALRLSVVGVRAPTPALGAWHRGSRPAGTSGLPTACALCVPEDVCCHRKDAAPAGLNLG